MNKPLFKYKLDIKTETGKTISTWGVYPVLNTTKIIDGVYDPEGKVLKLLFDSVTEQYIDYPVQTKNGKFEMQQRKLDQYYRGSINDQDIETFLSLYVDNNFEYTPPTNIITDIT